MRHVISKTCSRRNDWHYDTLAKETFLIELTPLEGKYSQLMFALNPHYGPHKTHCDEEFVSSSVRNRQSIPYARNQGICFNQEQGKFVHRGPHLKIRADGTNRKAERIFLQIKHLDVAW